MRALRLAVLIVASGTLLHAQEREVPKDSERVSISGCASDRRFIVVARPDEPVRSEIAPGRRFRLSGPRKMLDEIRKQERSMIEVTGLILKSNLSGGGGIAVGGGRVRIGGAPREPLGGLGRDTGYNEAILDLESWRPLPESCPAK